MQDLDHARGILSPAPLRQPRDGVPDHRPPRCANSPRAFPWPNDIGNSTPVHQILPIMAGFFRYQAARKSIAGTYCSRGPPSPRLQSNHTNQRGPADRRAWAEVSPSPARIMPGQHPGGGLTCGPLAWQNGLRPHAPTTRRPGEAASSVGGSARAYSVSPFRSRRGDLLITNQHVVRKRLAT